MAILFLRKMVFRFFCVIFKLALVATSGDKDDRITDTNLDILFILDQEQATTVVYGKDIDNTCKPHYMSRDRMIWCYKTDLYTFKEFANYETAYDGVNSWVGSILDKDDAVNTKFAVVHSCSQTLGGVMWKFNEKIINDKLLAVLSSENVGINHGCKKNLAWTMNLAVNDVFNNNAGRRPNASAIVIVVSDCLIPNDDGLVNYIDAVQDFFRKIKGKLYYMCYDYKHGAKEKFNIRMQDFKDNMLPWLKTNNQTDLSMIYVGNDSAEVGKRLDELMPKRSGVRNVDCGMVPNCSNCTRNIGGSGCRKTCAWHVNRWPTGTGKACVNKDNIFQEICDCPATTQSPTEGSKVLPIALGTLCALLTAVAILAIIVVCFVRTKRKKKRTKDRAVGGVGVKKVLAEIGADIKSSKSVNRPMGSTRSIALNKDGKSIGAKSPKCKKCKIHCFKSVRAEKQIPGK